MRYEDRFKEFNTNLNFGGNKITLDLENVVTFEESITTHGHTVVSMVSHGVMIDCSYQDFKQIVEAYHTPKPQF